MLGQCDLFVREGLGPSKERRRLACTERRRREKRKGIIRASRSLPANCLRSFVDFFSAFLSLSNLDDKLKFVGHRTEKARLNTMKRAYKVCDPEMTPS